MDLFTTDWKSCYQAAGLLDTNGNIPENAAPPLSCIFNVFQNIVNASLALAAIVAVFFIMYAGFQYVTSTGDKEKVDGARKRITYAIIGLLVIFFSFTVINIIAEFTGIDPQNLGIGN